MGRLGVGLGVGRRWRHSSAMPPSPSLNALFLSNAIIAESAAADALIGAVEGLTAGSTLSLLDNAGGRFALDGTDVVRGATALDYEDATSHDITLREVLAGALNTPRDTVQTISVTNVNEVSLVALGGTFSLAENAGAGANAGTLTGRTSGATIALLDDAGGQVALSGSDIVRGATALDFETDASVAFTIRETHPDAAAAHDTVLSLTVTDVDESGGGGTDPDAPVLTLESDPGDNPPRWSGDYSGMILGRDTVRLNWRVDTGGGFGSWSEEDHLVTDDDLANGSWDWTDFVADAPFAEGAVIEVREAVVRDAGDPAEAISAWSNVLSDTIEDATPSAFGFTDQTGVATSTLITSGAITVAGIAAGVDALATVDSGEYELNASGSWLPAGDFTVQLGDTVKLRHTSSATGSTATNQVLTIGGVSDTFTSTTVSSTAAFVPSPTQPTDVAGAGATTFADVPFDDGIALVFVGNNGVTSLPIAVQLDGVSMGAPIATIGTVGVNDLLTVYAAPVAAGDHDIFVDRAGTGAIKIMTGTLKNSDGVAVDTAGLIPATDANPHDATSQLDINASGIGVVMMLKPSTNTFVNFSGGVSVVATSPDGNRKLGVMTASAVPRFNTGSSAFVGIVAVAFDFA